MLPFRPAAEPSRASPQDPPGQGTAKERQSESGLSGTPQKASDDTDQHRVARDAEIDNGSEASTTPESLDPTGPEQNMPIATYRAPSVLPSEDPTSSGGPSLALPSLVGLDKLPIPRPTRSLEWPELPLHLEFDQAIRETPFEVHIEGPSESSTTVDTACLNPDDNPPLPWKFEFWWEAGTLHSSAGTLESAFLSLSCRSTKVIGATVGGSNGVSESTRASTMLVLVPTPDVPLHIAVDNEDNARWARKQRRGELVGALRVHFWRTHTGSQGANGPYRETSQHISNFSASAPSTTATPARPSATGGSSRRLLGGGGFGSGEDDDPQDGDGGGFRHPEGAMRQQTRRFACPFQKWRPQIFRHCLRRHRNVSEVKRHVIDNHYIFRCPQCHTSLRTPLARTAHYTNTGCGATPTPDLTPGHISEQQLAIIKRRPVRKSLEQQWRDLFRTIFPNEPQPRDVYVDRRVDRTIRYIEYQYDTCCRYFLRKHQAERAREDPFLDQFETLEAQREAVADQFIPSVMLDLDGQGTPGWSPPSAFWSGPRDYDNQIRSTAHGTPLTLDALGQTHGEPTEPYTVQPLEPSHVSPPPFNWDIGSPFNLQPTIQPTILPDATHAVLGYHSMPTQLVEQQPPAVPQPGQAFEHQVDRQTDEDIFAIIASHHTHNAGNTMSQLDSLDENHIGNNNTAFSVGYSVFAGAPSLPAPQRLAPVATAADGSLYTPPQPKGNSDDAATGPLATLVHRHMQWADIGPITPSHSTSSYVPYQDM
ncbi:uncharacterized protein B0H64DRAFT_374927 [Chaetomium fimeti]|uniref:C2H2-type domain-containing protein n=1 Tax=Chaetomium fimeti TaxID=1854472 RepID=A0AAE0HCQ1_9PEZI|nr:hypothetical protein B0H64DRAFT_374927 [Chaetomium fimeti]